MQFETEAQLAAAIRYLIGAGVLKFTRDGNVLRTDLSLIMREQNGQPVLRLAPLEVAETEPTALYDTPVRPGWEELAGHKCYGILGNHNVERIYEDAIGTTTPQTKAATAA